jgi:glycosyltransferase involved in cell wall biosynthesis
VNVLHISDNDLSSRRFNGYDWHDGLASLGINSELLVVHKISNSDFVHKIEPLDDIFTRSIIKNKAFLDADIVHVHLVHNTPFDYNYLPVISRLKPVLLHMHDPYWLGGHCIHHFDCMKWQGICHDCGYLSVPFTRIFDDTSLEFMLKKTAIQNSSISALGMSQWMVDKAKGSPIWSGKEIYYSNGPGIDQEIFKPPESKKQAKLAIGIDPDSTVLMFRAAKKNHFKGFDLLWDAIARLPLSLKIVLVGVDQKNCLDDFAGIFTVLDLGWIHDIKEIANYYRAADILLMPSMAEACGFMAIEAMSSGTMVLATEGTALSCIIRAPECGIAVPHNKDAYSLELRRLLESPAEVEERGKKSFAFAQANYSLEMFLQRLAGIYREVIGKYKPNDEVKLVIEQLKKYNSKYRNYFLAERIKKIRLAQSQIRI